MTTKLNLLFTILLLTLTHSYSRPSRPESSSTGSYSDQLKKNSKGNFNKNDKGYGPGGYPGLTTELATGFILPGSGPGGSYSELSGENNKGRAVRLSVVCKEKGHCYKKELTCPAKCFKSLSRNVKVYIGSGGGGGCTIDCKKCVAYC